jgi:hypothetical protein
MHHFTIVDPKRADIDVAQSQRLFEHRVENGGKVAGRSVDGLEHLRPRCLLRQRLIPLGFVPSQLALEINNDLPGIV